MNKATKRLNGNHYITKRITVNVGAKEILGHVLAVYGYENNLSRKWIEEQSAFDIVSEYDYDPEAYKWSSQKAKNRYLKHLKKALDFCIKKFPDIPSEEFKEEYYRYKRLLEGEED